MDISVIAAIGSFAISERVLKPKATALFILGCVLAYDLRTKTHDVTALRVYRGPALLAFTLMMAAYSLRTWRRNGVACDELLFLPGTLHGHEHGIEGPLIEMPHNPSSESSSSPSSSHPEQQQQSSSLQTDRFLCFKKTTPTASTSATLTATASSPEMRRRRTIPEDDGGDLTISDNCIPEITMESGETNTINKNNSSGAEATSGGAHSPSEQSWNMDEDETDEGHTLIHRNSSEVLSDRADASPPATPGTRMQRWQENHPKITRIGTFFFFRSNNTASGQNAAYAPSGPSVFGAALDLSMPVLFNFHVFIEAYNHVQSSPDASDVPIQLLPVVFLSVLLVRTAIPPGRRLRFWGTLKFSFMAPLHKVKFRDEFIGEALTSFVRPGQDLFFALSYYLMCIYGTITGKYGLTESGEYLEESWLLHNVMLPSFAILPLWLKYLQTLRQAYDSNKRWPYQANSLKYLTSTLVIIYAIAHPDQRRTAKWIISFLLTLIFQIGWDVLMDWELFELRRDIQLVDAEEPDSFCNRISSFRPSSHILLKLQMYVLQPVLDFYQRQRATMPSWGQIQLRRKRLYKTEIFYWKIFIANCIMRFTWMMCFIPAYHVTHSRTVLTSTSDVDSYWGVLLPVAEIVRRTLWGFLFLERETIKLMDSDSMYSKSNHNNKIASSSAGGGENDNDGTANNNHDDDDDDDSKFGERSFRTQLLPTWLDNQQQVAHNAATAATKQREYLMRQLFVVELFGWAAAFVVLGCWAAA